MDRTNLIGGVCKILGLPNKVKKTIYIKNKALGRIQPGALLI